MKLSAGILLYRINKEPEFFLVHPGGPFWAKKDQGAWSIPKGEYEEGADAFEAAKREFAEETGQKISGNFVRLTPLKQKSGKVISAWAVEGEFDTTKLVSNTFTIEWPPRSGKQNEFPEVDRAEWFDLTTAREKIIAGQAGFLEELNNLIGS
jgi:predicted NUDIX family NTP pyrophosphohydrolase